MVVRFGPSQDCQGDAKLPQQKAAVLPIAQVERDKEYTPHPGMCSLDNVELAWAGQPIMDRQAVFHAPQVDEFQSKVPMQAVGGLHGCCAVTGEDRQ
jgi:hypothetical protein